MSKKGHPFNVILSKTQVEQLSALASKSNCSQAQVIRWTIAAAYHMAFRATPSCADGSRCFVPHLHASAPSHHPPKTDVLDNDGFDPGPLPQ